MLQRNSGLALLTETVAAVDRTVTARFEGDLSLLSALCTRCRMHFATATAATTTVATTATAASTAAGGFLGSATWRATLGFVGETELVVAFLLCARENETSATFDAGQIFVREFHMLPTLGKTIKMLPRTIGEIRRIKVRIDLGCNQNLNLFKNFFPNIHFRAQKALF